MRILHLSRSDHEGGASRAAFRIHKGLLDAKIESKMLVGNKGSGNPNVLGPKSTYERLLNQFLPILDEAPARLAYRSSSLPRSTGWIGKRLAPIVEKLNPELVMLHWITGGFMTVSEIARLAKRPIVWRLADMWPFCGTEHYVEDSTRFQFGYEPIPNGSWEFDLDRFAWKRKLRFYNYIENLTLVAPSHWMASQARKSALFSSRDIQVIPTGHDLTVFSPYPKEIARRHLGLPTEKHIVLFGSVNPFKDVRKGFRELSKALEILKTRTPGGEIVIATFGAEMDETIRASLPFPTHHLGKFADGHSLALIYSAADVFVAPSLQENLANTVIESMACGTPTVAFRTGGMPELISHMVNGYLAFPYDPKDLAEGILWILNSSSRRRKLGESARYHVETHFSLDNQTKSYIELFGSILDSQGSYNID